jgi:hypothetical protein
MDKFGKSPVQKRRKGRDIVQILNEKPQPQPKKTLIDKFKKVFSERREGSIAGLAEYVDDVKNESDRVKEEVKKAEDKYNEYIQKMAELLTITTYSRSTFRDEKSAVGSSSSRRSVGSIVAEATIDETFGKDIEKITKAYQSVPIITYKTLNDKVINNNNFKKLRDVIEGRPTDATLDEALREAYMIPDKIKNLKDFPNKKPYLIELMVGDALQDIRPHIKDGNLDLISCEFDRHLSYLYLYAYKVNIQYLQYEVLPQAIKILNNMKKLIEFFNKGPDLINFIKQRVPEFDITVIKQDERKAEEKIEKNIRPYIAKLTNSIPEIYKRIKDNTCVLLKSVDKLCKTGKDETCCEVLKGALDIDEFKFNDIKCSFKNFTTSFIFTSFT